ncbi:M48 family metallopeptidase [Desulfolutivibrio sulfoxidireducens]|uniref:M48 family metallopeptidase n=1 Tax=Desulfolutivibrio sulfoxidireducens TaxID=2773299 RepID=UPI00159EACDE|nr:YgjP-like metallopeptidase domain-containing protein [Desulfolutivibrio sulfoxidireducens]QLA18868.1 DUF45 domain-containing protein [Desulfolutivibrio sulfoxidireducens]
MVSRGTRNTSAQGARARSRTSAEALAAASRLAASLLDVPVPVSVRVSRRARGIVLRMLPDRGLEVVAPEGFDPALLPLAVESRRAWIEDAVARLAAMGELPGMVPVTLPRRVVLTAFGLEYGVDYLERPGLGQARAACLIREMGGGRLAVTMRPGGAGEGREAARQGLCAFVRDRAGPLLVAALREVSREVGLPFASARVRRQRTRWGSCTAAGRISLNVTLAFLPWELARYVFVHELCHTLHQNHSTRFWDAVRAVEPDAPALDATLAQAGRYVPLWFTRGITATAS